MQYTDDYFMQAALDEAELALAQNEVPIGAVVVLDNLIIARGHNMTQTLNDVTAHAEMIAITAAENYLGAKYLTDCTLYVTIEPCIMCAGAIAWTQLHQLVFGAADPKRGFSTLKDNILHKKTIVKSGILEKECGRIMQLFFQSKRV